MEHPGISAIPEPRVKQELTPALAEREDLDQYPCPIPGRSADHFAIKLTQKIPAFAQTHPHEHIDPTKPEAGARVWFYVGTASNNIGKDGDFYLEEETNTLYGSKAGGAWPEDGVKVSGPVLKKKHRDPQKGWAMDLSRLPREPKTKHGSVLQLCKSASSRLLHWICHSGGLTLLKHLSASSDHRHKHHG